MNTKSILRRNWGLGQARLMASWTMGGLIICGGAGIRKVPQAESMKGGMPVISIEPMVGSPALKQKRQPADFKGRIGNTDVAAGFILE